MNNTGQDSPIFRTISLSVYYAERQVLADVNLGIMRNEVTAIIGPSGCGKSTFIRCLNRMNDVIDECVVKGQVFLDDRDIYHRDVDVVELRARVGMVFQKPNPFPKSVYDNVAYGPRLHGLCKTRADLDKTVYTALEKVGLLHEVDGSLDLSGTKLSGGQQQRLCIARAIAVNPDVILMDEPCSSLDPISTAKIEGLISELRKNYTILMVTHSMQQARRISQRTAYFHLGRLIEVDETSGIFSKPKTELAKQYISGRIG